jgi:heavy metal sensor kinase
MRIDSFRLRIALLSVVVAGLVVLGFGATSWVLIRRASLGQVDEQAKARVLQCLALMPHDWLWRDTRAVAQVIDESYRSGAWALMVKDSRNQLVYRSPNWPADLPAEHFSQVANDGSGTPKTPSAERHSEQPPRLGAPPAGPEADFRFLDGPPPGDPGGMPPPREGMAPMPPSQVPPPLVDLQYKTSRVGGRSWRLATAGNPHLSLVIGMDLSAFDDNMLLARNAFLFASPVALLLVAFGAWFIAQHALRPIARLTDAVEGITASDLAQRLPSDRMDAEFQRLIRVFNAMMERLEKSFEQAARFSADAAHELNTPLTILQGHLDNAIQASPTGSDEQRTYGTLQDQVQRLKTVMRKLLLLARADSGRLAGKLATVNLSELVENLQVDIEDMAPELDLQVSLTPDLLVSGDRDLLVQLLQNLASNASKYATAAGWIRLELCKKGKNAILTVANSGEEIGEEDRKRIFDRFYRIDKSRVNRADNVGLGLSLAQEIARAHGGELVLDQAWDGVVAFKLTLPQAGQTSNS